MPRILVLVMAWVLALYPLAQSAATNPMLNGCHPSGH